MRRLVMLDTNVVLALWHNHTKALRKLEAFAEYRFCISSLVATEVLVGAHMPYKSETKKFLRNSFEMHLFDEQAALVSIDLAGKYFVDRSSKPYDLLIAAHALSVKAPLITNNIKDYSFGRLKLFHFEEGKWL